MVLGIYPHNYQLMPIGLNQRLLKELSAAFTTMKNKCDANLGRPLFIKFHYFFTMIILSVSSFFMPCNSILPSLQKISMVL